MPSRLVSLLILLYWSVAAFGLFTREILPDFFIGSPPDLRSVAQTAEDPEPVRWSILVSDDGATLSNLRAVGRATTQTRRTAEGWTRLDSDVWLDANGLLRATPFAFKNEDNIRLQIASRYDIDASGNLRTFEANVRAAEDVQPLLTLLGTVKSDAIEVKARGPVPLLNWTKSFPYEPHGMVQNAMGPIEMLPGLQVGQRWRTRVVSPLTGRVEEVKVEVARSRVIHWGKSPVTVLEVVHHMEPLTARTWVRPDGLVLRQEVPFPFVRLVVERNPD